ncbi:ABC transporter ATP-binding protein [Peptoniphilaceae bacterium SGI.137]
MIEVNQVVKRYRVKQQSQKWLANLFHAEYRTAAAVRGISFHIDKGEMVGLIGLNGAGKTTTLKMLSGLIHPSEGTILVDGFTPKELKSDYLKKIGLIMGNKSQLWWDVSAYASFELEGAIYGLKDDTIRQKAETLAEFLDVRDLLKTPVRKLSMGERMKMELILVLLHDPSILFFDEPTIGLDILSQKKLREFIKRYHQEHMATMIITSHNMRDVEELCDRILVIDHGTILYDGTIAALSSYRQKNDTNPADDFEETIAGLLEGGYRV